LSNYRSLFVYSITTGKKPGIYFKQYYERRPDKLPGTGKLRVNR